ncbi:MAG: hypothetical protein R2932_54040 [Caldilineaceae bacterium]
MTNRNCWLQDSNVESELETFFSEVDRQVSTYYEQNSSTFETHLDGQIVAYLRNQQAIDLSMQRIQRERANKHLPPFTLQFNAKHVTNKEIVHGADLGVVCRIQLPREYAITKAALIQTKRLYMNSKAEFNDKCVYKELFTTAQTLKPQWERLLNITPASVYALYGPLRLKVKRTIQNFGIRIVSAQHVAGIANTTSQFTALDAYERGITFADWIVNAFICCNVGDTRQEVIDTAMGMNNDFPVRYAIEIAITGEERTLPLFEQSH